MKSGYTYKVIGLIAICALLSIIQLGFGYRAYGSESILYQSTFDNNNGLQFLQGSWSLSSGDLIPVYNTENRLVLDGTNKSDYRITLNAIFLSGNTGQSGYSIYFRISE